MTRDLKNLIVGLDIGTSKVVAVVAEVMPDGRHEVIGLGQHESRGLKKGVVVNIEATVESIQRALEEAELMADCKIRNVYTGIAGSHIDSFNSTGMVAIKDKEVSAADVARVIETAKAVNISTGQQLLHTLPQEFVRPLPANCCLTHPGHRFKRCPHRIQVGCKKIAVDARYCGTFNRQCINVTQLRAFHSLHNNRPDRKHRPLRQPPKARSQQCQYAQTCQCVCDCIQDFDVVPDIHFAWSGFHSFDGFRSSVADRKIWRHKSS